MRRRHWNFRFLAIWATVGSTVVGCYGGDGLPRQPVSGLVTLDGRLVKHGLITFYPAEQLVKGVMIVAGDMIKDGRFSIAPAYRLVPGRYRIAIHSEERAPKQ